MRVDRKRFLLLTAAISSGACSPERSSKPPVVVADPSEVAGPIAVDLAAPSATDDRSRDRTLGAETGSGGELSDRPPGAAERPRRADRHAEPTHAPSELVARCQTLKPPQGPHCEGFHWTHALCEGFDRSLQPAVARSAVQCLLRHSQQRSICLPRTREDCFQKALAAAPNTRYDRGRCAALVSHCTQAGHGDKALTKRSCRRAVAAVRRAFRDEMLTCIAESCGLRQCVYIVEP